MSFLLPMAWWALALGIPIVAFYLIKTRLQRKIVSSSLFWQQLSPQIYNTSIWRKLRRWLSLLLQLLFLTALAFALAQPLASWQSLQPASLVLVLDPSASMDATDVEPSRWQRAVQLAEQRIRQMRAFDEATLLLAIDPPRVLSSWSSGKRTLLGALAGASPVGRATDIRPAVALARNLAEGRTHGRVTLFSDGAWAEPPAKELLTNVETVWIAGDGVNAGITLFAVRRAFTGPGEFQLAARVEARGPGPVSGEIEILRDGRTMDTQAVTLTPGQPWEHTWDGRAHGRTRFEARFHGFPPDRLARDDAAAAELLAQTPINVELIAPPNAFLDAALKALDLTTWKRTWPPEALVAAQPRTLYVFYRSLPPEGFAPEACVIIDPSASGFWGELRGPLEQPLVSEFQRESPLLRHAGIENVTLQSAREFAPAPGAEVLAESFGKPLIFGNWRGERRWLVLAFDLETSDFVLRTAFPIVLGNVVESLRQSSEAAPAEPLPGSVETALARTAQIDTLAAATASAPTSISLSWWSAFPIWWWAVAFGICWLLGEWWSFSRRITE